MMKLIRTIFLIAAFIVLISAFAAMFSIKFELMVKDAQSAECYQWPLSGAPYDGDTFAVTVPGLPDELARVSIRVRGVDTPEIRGECESEVAAAKRAQEFTAGWLNRGYQICRPEWGKYGGRIIADVTQGQRNLAQDLIVRGFGRVYDGGERERWCD